MYLFIFVQNIRFVLFVGVKLLSYSDLSDWLCMSFCGLLLFLKLQIAHM